MSLRLGMSTESLECQRLAEELAKTGASAADVAKAIERRRRALALLGERRLRRRKAAAIVREVYLILEDFEPGDDLEKDVIPGVRAVVEDAFGVREPGEEDAE